MNRREFVQTTGALGGWAALQPFFPNLPGLPEFWPSSKKPEPLDPERIGVIQGPTTESTTLISIVAHKKHNLRFYFSDLTLTFRATAINLVYGDFIIHNLRIDGLRLDQPYELRIESDSGLTERRFFRALDMQKADGRLAIVSCTNHKRAEPQKLMGERLLQSDPDAILFLGDLVYANRGIDTIRGDAAKPEDAYENYVRTFQELDLYRIENLKPVFYIWDDHDAGKNNANSAHPYLGQMMQIFRAFFPLEDLGPALKTGPGFGFALNLFGTQILVFDQRTFATDEGLMLGDRQMAWMKEQIARQTGPVLLCGSQLYWKYHWWGESFQKKAANELALFLGVIRKSGRPAVFISGDVHYTQIQEIPVERVGYVTYEVTSSALFSRSAGKLGRRKVSEGQLEYYGDPNFLLFDNWRLSETSLDVRVTCYTEKAPAFVRDLHVSV